MISWNESLFAASGSHDQLVSFSSIPIINKKMIEYMNHHTLKIVLKDRKLIGKA